eukprot:g67964.t1
MKSISNARSLCPGSSSLTTVSGGEEALLAKPRVVVQVIFNISHICLFTYRNGFQFREEEVSPRSNDEVRLAVELQADASAAADQVFFKELGPSWVAGQAPGRSTEKYQAT